MELVQGNYEAAKIYNLVQGQVLFRFDGERDMVVELNQPALWKLLEKHKVKNETEIFERIYQTFHNILAMARERGD